MQSERFTLIDFRFATYLSKIELAMQPRSRLVRYQMQRIMSGTLTAEPFLFIEPYRMTGTIVLIKSRNGFREDFDATRRRA